MSKKDRFSLKSRFLDAISDDTSWNFQRTNLLLREFGLTALDSSGAGPDIAEVIAELPDSELVEMLAAVTGLETEKFPEAHSSELVGWKPGYVRLFISHSGQHNEFVREVADELAPLGIHGFVAHDEMAYSEPWQAQIERALQTMQVFVAIVHPEFPDSDWCNQEVGWALGRAVPTYAVRLGVAPTGFIGRQQWPEAKSNAASVALIISSWVSELPEIGDAILDGVLSALESASGYYDAGAAAKQIAAFGRLNNSQWERLDRIFWANDQVRTGILPTRALEPFYADNGRLWPPAQTPA